MKISFILNKKGFISGYFIFLFFLVTSLIGLFAINVTLKYKTLYNLRLNATYLNQEIFILNDIKCRLSNNKIEDYTTSFRDTFYRVDFQKNIILVDIESNHSQEMIISLNEEYDIPYILDYETKVLDKKGI